MIILPRSHFPSLAFAYCQDNATGVIYLHGNGDDFANMDVDCDGLQTGPVDGRCKSSTDTQSETAFMDTVQQYSKAQGDYIRDLNANFIPYVVFGNYGKKKGYTNFHPTKYGVKPLSVMAVVCGDQLVWLYQALVVGTANSNRCMEFGGTRMETMGSL